MKNLFVIPACSYLLLCDSSNDVSSCPLVKLKTEIPSMSSSYDNLTMKINVDFVPKKNKKQ